MSDVGEQRRQQRQGDQHADEDHDRGGQSERRDERDGMPMTNSPSRAIATATPARRRRGPRCLRARHGLLDAQPPAQSLAETGDHQERVVNTDAEPDQSGKARREAGEIEEAGGEHDAERAGEETDQRARDRQPIATIEPKAISRTIIAAPSPINSVAPD